MRSAFRYFFRVRARPTKRNITRMDAEHSRRSSLHRGLEEQDDEGESRPAMISFVARMGDRTATVARLLWRAPVVEGG
jgi:hypothetical protein